MRVSLVLQRMYCCSCLLDQLLEGALEGGALEELLVVVEEQMAGGDIDDTNVVDSYVDGRVYIDVDNCVVFGMHDDSGPMLDRARPERLK